MTLCIQKNISEIFIFPTPNVLYSCWMSTETRKAFPLRLINELRSLSYRNMYMNKLAFMYARKSYLL